MIETVIRWSISNRLIVLFATLCISLIGVYSVKNTPVDAIPDLSDVQVIVKTSFPGQSPQVVQDQVTYPLTSALMSVPGAANVRGFSFFGDSYVYVVFKDQTDLYWARSRVLEYLNQASDRLPQGVEPRLGPDASGVGWVYIYALSDSSGRHDLADLKSIQDWFLRYELQAVEGVSEVAAIGGMTKQYQVEIDPIKLQAFSIPATHVANALRRGNQETGASVIEMSESEYMVTSSGYLSSLDDIRSIPLGVDMKGVAIDVSDVATVSQGPSMRRGVAELNGDGEVVGGIIVMRSGENAKHTIDAVKSRLSQLEQSLPEGVTITSVYDRSQLIERAVDNLITKIGQELIIVALICALFLFHFRSALVAVISLPVGVLAAFAIMYQQGVNANIMSLGGIVIAIGAMTDGAIVLVENMHRHMAREASSKLSRWQVVANASVEVGPALFFSLLIVTLSFLPVFILEAQEGRMFAPLAYTKTYAMAVTAGLAITLVPVLMGYMIRGGVVDANKNPINRFVVGCYKPILCGVLKSPKSAVAIAFLVTLSALYPVSKIGAEFMPELDEGDLMYMPTTYPSISIGQARQLLQQTDRLIRTIPEVNNVLGKVGRADTATDPAPLTMIETFIQLKPKSEWREGVTTASIKDELSNLVQIPGVTNAWVMPIKTRIDMLATGIKTPVGINISGAELSKIQQLGEQLESILEDVDGTTSVYSDRVSGGRYIDIELNREKLARFSLNVADLQEIVNAAISGAPVTETVEGLERYSVNLRYPQHYRDSPEALRKLPLVLPNGMFITLQDVADVRISAGPSGIKSENARLVGTVFVDINDVDIASYVKRAKKAVANNLELPLGYSLSWEGQFQYMERAKAQLTLVVPLMLAVILMLLYFSFKRVKDVLLICCTLPCAVVGGLWFMYWHGFNLSVAVVVGFIALTGLAIEIGVLMLVYLNQSIKDQRERAAAQTKAVSYSELLEAIEEGALRRVRPIIMTAVTVILGLLPVMTGDGAGNELMSRIAAPMIGGMASVLVLALVVLPAMCAITVQPSPREK